MINQKALNGNRFSIKPPNHENETGALTFGITDDHPRLGDRIRRVPLTATAIPFMPTPWQTRLDAIHTVNGSAVLHNHTVIFEPAMSTLGLPDIILGPWLKMINPRPLGFLLQEIDCGRRDSMPSISLEMGGHNFTIGPYEYSYEAHFKESGEVHCILDVTEGTEDISVLGLSFLQRFYSVFDWDNREIGLLPTDQFHR
ncbi:hypothetical protein ASPWEDRAFT_307821 [Aspergillus wentii DTO 134E9]|uniref:Peptidase A1 domain-containing protein n=1 Tax=Aspergillus wentii DTO 134E9 TaxID=1073089 RepID=A0A1L9RSV9_ASPWE|nr:uncharacterized protein ASPWEDRAFT_307821 [Aspergillus wentii DTO 134E9]OJJ38041.1 hypothetical protein ASPWEDRAFT_307821 [Aspergillus wentii DTO 134E9]